LHFSPKIVKNVKLAECEVNGKNPRRRRVDKIAKNNDIEANKEEVSLCFFHSLVASYYYYNLSLNINYDID